jgi:hypothetical protein
MSYYSVKNPSKFVTQNPDVNTAQSIQFLKNGFQQPSGKNSLAELSGNDIDYTAEAEYQ